MKRTICVLGLALMLCAKSNGDFGAWQNSDKWDVASDAILDPGNNRRLIGQPGTGVLVNGKEGNCPSLVTKRRDYRDVEVHVEFMVAKGSNSGVIFHGNYEIQIFDSYGKRKPTAGDCGGIYPQAEAEPTYHHIGGGSAPRINAARPPGQWQTLDIIFQSPRFDESGKKMAHAKFVKVVHNGVVIQENVEVPYACGTNWNRKQYPQGPVIIQGDYGPIAVRNVRVRDYKPGAEQVPVPPEGFTALFNGKDFTGWRVESKIKAAWSIEGGVLKALAPVAEWIPDLETLVKYRDFILLVDFRLPSASNSGVYIRGLAPVNVLGGREKIDINPGRMGHPLSFHYLTPDIKLADSEFPRVKGIHPAVGIWHTMKITLVGTTLSIEVDGEVILHEFEYPEGILSMDSSPIGLQKHKQEIQDGKLCDMPIEFRNIFIKEINRDEAADAQRLNEPPEGFTSLFNGKNFNGWRLSPHVQEAWSIEDGVLKSHVTIKDWGADLRTVKEYRDFVLMVDYRIPRISDSGIYIRGLMPGIGIFDRDRWEQFNLRSRGGTGSLESFRFQPLDRRVEPPRVKYIDPEVGVWHTVKLTLIGKTLSAEYDGETIIDNYEYADGILSMEPSVIRLQKHPPCEIAGEMSDCPIEFRNIFIKEIKPSGFPRPIKPPELNVPPRGFTSLFNGKDFTGWRVTPNVRRAWIIEDGVLKAHGEIKEWGADLMTEKKYRDFVLLVDFKFPTTSDSGIWFRGIPGIMGGMEQFNLMSVYGTGNLDSLDHLPKDIQLSFRDAAYAPFFYCQPEYYHLKDPPIRYMDPEVGVWHTVKLTLIGRTLSAELDGHVIHDRFEYPEGTISTEPAPIRLQKHVPQTIAGRLYEECPIEFRNIFIKEIEPSESSEPGESLESNAALVNLLARIDTRSLPPGYNPQKHQDYVDRRMAGLSDAQRTQVGQLWREKQRIDPDMRNRGQSFVRIMEYVAGNRK